MRGSYVFVLFNLLALTVMSSVDVPVIGGRAAGMGGTSVTGTDCWSIANNQAGMAWMRGWQVGLFGENCYLIPEMSRETAAVSWSGRPGAFGLSIIHYGFQLYREVQAGISYARKFGNRFSAGIQLNYQTIQIGNGYGSKGLVSCSIGMLYKPDPAWTIGIHVSNPTGMTVTDTPSERMQLLFRAGLAYDIRKKILIMAEVEKDLVNKLIFRSGLEIRIVRSLSGRIGIITNPLMITGGLGFALGKVSIDLATGYHLGLGFYPSISIIYGLTEK